MDIDKQLRALLLEAMGDFPTEHMLGYHIDNFRELIDDARQEGYKKGYADRGIEELTK